mmetsp:Transcript_33612/g.79276  ORF Transcript_33612/g.79276 Transcript_33612/m.79276 type:complete len:82 (-) Transcript_33612:626-871(-)
MFACNFSLGTEVLVDVDNQGGDDAEKQSESDDDGIPDPLGERSLALGEEACLSFVLGEGWKIVIPVAEIDKVHSTHGGLEW